MPHIVIGPDPDARLDPDSQAKQEHVLDAILTQNERSTGPDQIGRRARQWKRVQEQLALLEQILGEPVRNLTELRDGYDAWVKMRPVVNLVPGSIAVESKEVE